MPIVVNPSQSIWAEPQAIEEESPNPEEDDRSCRPLCWLVWLRANTIIPLRFKLHSRRNIAVKLYSSFSGNEPLTFLFSSNLIMFVFFCLVQWTNLIMFNLITVNHKFCELSLYHFRLLCDSSTWDDQAVIKLLFLCYMINIKQKQKTQNAPSKRLCIWERKCYTWRLLKIYTWHPHHQFPKPPNKNQLYSTPPSAKHLQYNKVPKTKNEIMGTRNFSSPPHRQPASKHMIWNVRQFISEKMSRVGRKKANSKILDSNASFKIYIVSEI